MNYIKAGTADYLHTMTARTLALSGRLIISLLLKKIKMQ